MLESSSVLERNTSRGEGHTTKQRGGAYDQAKGRGVSSGQMTRAGLFGKGTCAIWEKNRHWRRSLEGISTTLPPGDEGTRRMSGWKKGRVLSCGEMNECLQY